jgi:hypothetical protein
MSREISWTIMMRRLAFRLRRPLWAAALGGAVSLPVINAHPQTITVGTRPDSPAFAQAQDERARQATAVRAIPLPDLSSLDVPLLIRESDQMGAAMHSQLPEFTYLQTRRSRELSHSGKLVEHVSIYEAYPILAQGRHRHIISLISEDGALVSPGRLKKERLRAAKELESAEHDRSSLQATGAPTQVAEKYIAAGFAVSQVGDGVWVGVSQFLRKCSFGAPRYEKLQGRNAIALDIRSCAGASGDPRERYMAWMSGIIWIDAEDKVVVRLAAWPKNEALPGKDSSPPSIPETILYEQTRLPCGLWVPKSIRLNAIGKAAIFNGAEKDMTFEFGQYQRFNTEVKDLQQMTVKSKP